MFYVQKGKFFSFTFLFFVFFVLQQAYAQELEIEPGEMYSLSHFSAKGIVQDGSSFEGVTFWTWINDDKGVIVASMTDGIRVIHLDVQPHKICYDVATVICLDVTVTETKNAKFTKPGDNAVLVFDMPTKQKISVMTGELTASEIDIDIEKFKVKKMSRLVEEYKQDAEIDVLKEETMSKLQVALELVKVPQIQKALIESNVEFEAMDDAYAVIDQRDEEWRAAGDKITPFMGTLMGTKVSEMLQNVMLQDKIRAQDFAYEEIFLTNVYGANVAQTGKTTDYKQWDEQWWVLAKQNGVHFDRGYDESTQINALDMSVRITDEKGKFLGIMKFVINIEKIIEG